MEKLSALKSLICKTLVVTMTIQSISIVAFAGGDQILNAKSCLVTKDKTNEVLQAICGQKKLPGTDRLVNYRTFNDPETGEVIEQWRTGRAKEVLTRTHTPSFDRAEVVNRREEVNIVTYDNSVKAAKKNSDEAWTTTGKVLTIGAAVVAVIGAFIGIRAMIKSKSGVPMEDAVTPEERSKATARKSRIVRASVKNPIVSEMPKKITIGSEVPNVKQGTKVKVAGAVPTSSVPKEVPRFSDGNGHTYIVQQNPNTNMLETLLLYDMLTRPYYHTHCYSYADFHTHSPFVYESGTNTVVIRESHTNTVLNYDSTAQSDSIGSSRVRDAEVSSVTSYSESRSTYSDRFSTEADTGYSSTSSKSDRYEPSSSSDSSSSYSSSDSSSSYSSSSTDF